MKKIIFVLLFVFSFFALVACNEGGQEEGPSYKVAMITDYGDITDQSFNQATYEGCKDWCQANSVDFKYFKPASDSNDDRIASTKKAISEGYNVIVMPGYAFGPAIEGTAHLYPDVHFIALDVSAGDFSQGYQLPSNVYCAVYQEEIAGFFAGYAAVMEGYTKLGFLGGMAVPAVVRYGYGFVQGADKAAQEKNVEISINYVYGGQFFGDADITAAMDTWYNAGTEVVFACGGGIFTSAAEAAKKVNAKVIGVDVDQRPTIDGLYGEGRTVTSAMKGLYATVQTALTGLIKEGKFESKVDTLGLVSKTEVEKNYVQLPVSGWAMKNFTVAQYKELVGKVFDKQIVVSNAIDAHPTVSAKTTVDYQNSIK